VLRKSDARKLAVAARLRRETTLPIKTIAALLHLGTSKSANATIHRFMKSNPAVDEAKADDVGI